MRESIVPGGLWKSIQRLEEMEASYLALLEEKDGVVDETVEMVEEGIAELGTNAMESLCWYAREAEVTIEAVRAEGRRLDEVGSRAKARVLWAKKLMKTVLAGRGVRKMKAGTFSVRLSRAPEKVVLSGEEEPLATLLPERFQRKKTTIEVDKTEVKKELRAGKKVSGYKLGRGPDTVTIR